MLVCILWFPSVDVGVLDEKSVRDKHIGLLLIYGLKDSLVG